MAAEEHRLRVGRLMRGDRNVTDLDRLFADLRFADPGRPTVTEIGDFAAHREERNKGIAMRRASDIQISARIWVRQHFGIVPSIEDARAAGFANLKIATDEQIRRQLGTNRQVARSQFIQGLKQLERGQMPSAKQKAAVDYLGGSFVWQFAFDDATLAGEFADVLIESGALAASDRDAFIGIAPFFALHAITLMHGARLELPDRQFAPLRAVVRAETGTLRVVADVPVENFGKPIGCIVTIFETGLAAADHCDVELPGDPLTAVFPLEIGRDGRLVALG
jgi:hypothetical protein